MQWIPTNRGESGVVFGDIFVAFARPSKGKSSLVVYTDKSEETWMGFKSSRSLGQFINTMMGPPLDQDDMTSELYDFYRGKHVGYSRWIFEEMDRWRSIRPNNELVGIEAKTAAGATEAVTSDPRIKAAAERRARRRGDKGL
jgi:hypothetical protein